MKRLKKICSSLRFNASGKFVPKKATSSEPGGPEPLAIHVDRITVKRDKYWGNVHDTDSSWAITCNREHENVACEFHYMVQVPVKSYLVSSLVYCLHGVTKGSRKMQRIYEYRAITSSVLIHSCSCPPPSGRALLYSLQKVQRFPYNLISRIISALEFIRYTTHFYKCQS